VSHPDLPAAGHPALLALLGGLLAFGCGDPLGARARLAEAVNTVVVVQWQPLGGGEAWVEFGSSGALERSTPVVADGEGPSQALLLGLGAWQEVCWRVAARSGDSRVSSPESCIETGGLPAELPELQLAEGSAPLDGYLLATAWIERRVALLLLGEQGAIRWYHLLPEERSAIWAAPQLGGGGLQYLAAHEQAALEGGSLVQVDWQGIIQSEQTLEGAHHAVVQHDDGRLAWLATDLRDTEELGPVIGDRVLIMDPANGELETLFSTWDWLEPSEEQLGLTSSWAAGRDWTHGNSLRWSAERDSYWLTLRGTDQLMELDAHSGALLTVIGADSYTAEPAEAAFWGRDYYDVGPHGAAWTADDSLLVFDNGPVADWTSDSAEDPWSRLLELELDEAGQIARPLRIHEAGRGRMAWFMGGATRLDDGGTLVSWGSAGVLERLDEDAQPSWALEGEAAWGPATWIPDPYAGE